MFVPRIDLAKQTLKTYKDLKLDCEMIGDGKTKLDDNNCNIIICVNGSIKHINKKTKYKYLFIDEAHHFEKEGSKNLKMIDVLKSDKIIHFSATFHKTNNLDFNYPLRKAIDDGWIADYVLDFNIFTKGERMDALVSILKNKTEYSPMLVYFNSTNRCKEFGRKMKKHNVKIDYLTGEASERKRTKTKKDLEDGSLDVLSLCGMYNEGISIDSIRTVVFGDLRHSDINKIQIMMRANRLHHSKPFYRVIIPTTETDLSGNDMKEIVQTFCKIDEKMKICIENKGGTRIRVNCVDVKDDKAELLYNQVYDSLGTFIGGKSNEELWDDRLEQVKKYIDMNGKRPHSKDNNDKIRKLGNWVCNNMKYYEYIWVNNPQRRKKWEDFITFKKYRVYFITGKNIWDENLVKIKKYIDINKKLPSIYDSSDELQYLARWLSRQNNLCNKKMDIMKNSAYREKWKQFIADKKYKQFFVSGEDMWIEKLTEIKKWMDNNEKKPSPTSKNIYVKGLGVWISTQVQIYRKKIAIMKQREIYIKWKDFTDDPKYRKHFMSKGEIWDKNLKDVIQFINKNKKRPPGCSKDKTIKSLGCWISSQITAYKKNIKIMSKEKYRNKWGQFVNNTKYKKLFN